MKCHQHWLYSKHCFWVLIFCTLAGCASPTTVHIYGKYFDDTDLQPLVAILEEHEYQVETNSLDIPSTISENAILHSLMLDDNTKVDQVQQLANQSGFNINHLLPLTRANHWYTKNSMALILFPENPASSGHIFRQDLDNDYTSENCNYELTMQLNSDGNFQIVGEVADYQWTKEEEHLRSGVWYYRQFPYLELRPQNRTERSMYFEISKHSKRDKISEIELLKLTPLGNYPWIGKCGFEYGERLNN